MALVSKAFGDIITFTRASTATYFDSAGVLQSAAIDTPRFDYDPATLAAQGFLIEEARTNLLLQSAAFNTTWAANNVTITADTTASPDGGTNGDSLTVNVVGGYVSQTSQAFTAGSTITFSVFAKKNASNFLRVELGNIVSCWFNLNTGATASNNAGSGNVLFSSKSIQAISNGWYRCVLTVTTSTITTLLTSIYATDSDGNTSSINSSVFLWGAQEEVGAFPTSYIPTTTTALTRSADLASVNTLSPWFNATESTLYAEVLLANLPAVSTFPQYAALNDGSANNLISLSSNGFANHRVSVRSGGASLWDVNAGGSIVAGTPSKWALAVASGSQAACANGGAVATNSAAGLPTGMNAMRIGAQFTGASVSGASWLRRITYYPRKLSSAELQSLTA